MQKNDRNQTEQNKHGDRQSDHDGKRGGNHTPSHKPADPSPREAEQPAKPGRKR